MKYTLVLFVLFLWSCTEKIEVEPRDFDVVKTLAVTNITADGALFRAEMLFRSTDDVKNYGFVWSDSEDPTLLTSDKVIYSDTSDPAKFSSIISTTLEKDKTYFVRGFVETENTIVYGEVVEFVSLGSNAHTISEVRPLVGTIGDTVVIVGKGFSHDLMKNKVTFDDHTATIAIANDTLLKVIVPNASSESYQMSVSLVGNKTIYSKPFVTSTPIITNIQPKVAAIDDTITVSGSDFSYIPTENIVKVNGIDARVVYAHKSQVKFIIPSNLAEGNNSLFLEVGRNSTSVQDAIDFKVPKVYSLDKYTGDFGEVVTLTGENLSTLNESNLVILQSHPSGNSPTKCKVISASKNQVSFEVSNDVTRSSVEVELIVAGRTFKVGSFEINGPTIEEVSPNEFTTYKDEERVIIITGKNFNTNPRKNQVHIGNRWVKILDVKSNRMLVRTSGRIPSHQDNSVVTKLDVKVKSLDKSDTKTEAISVEYYSKWLEKASFPGIERSFAIGFVIDGKAYVGLGHGENDLWKYDPVDDSWEQMADFPLSQSFWSASFVVGEKAYVVGGISGSDRDGTSDVWEYNSNLNTWSQLNDFPGAGKHTLFSFATSDKGYVGGGYLSRTYSTDFWEYNPSSDSWAAKSSLNFDSAPNPEFKGLALNNQGYIYSRVHGFMAVYNVESDSWSKKASAQGDYANVSGLFSIDENIYVGFSSWSAGNRASLFSFDTRENKWSTTSVFGEFVKSRPVLFTINNTGYVIGTNSNKALWQYDPTR